MCLLSCFSIGSLITRTVVNLTAAKLSAGNSILLGYDSASVGVRMLTFRGAVVNRRDLETSRSYYALTQSRIPE
jgi:hypothetical protein